MNFPRARIIKLPKIHDKRGDLTFIESYSHIPFDIKRCYYLYNVPTNSVRGGHAHKQLEQLLIAVSGSFRVSLDDGNSRTTHILRDPSEGLYINTMVWREIDDFSQGSVCLVIASMPYNEDDYYRNYNHFINALKNND